MSNDRRLVYSTEHGSLDKPMRGKTKRHASRRTPQTNIKKPGKQGVRVRRESKGRGGKTVCVISGLDLSAAELKALLKKLKGQLGTGGAVKGGELEIQGDHRDKLLTLLAQEGFPARAAGG